MDRQSKPNILIIVIDSLRADHCSCYGYHRQTTPNIDRLAAEGCLFETCITAAPFSPASYASLFSNLYPHQHGVNGDTVRVWPNTFTRLAERMKSNGYTTIGVSNNAFVGAATNAIAGFDDFTEMFRRSWLMNKYSGLIRRVRGHISSQLADILEPHHARWPEMRSSLKSMRLLQDRITRTDSPFFAVAILMDPHNPYDIRHRKQCGNSPAVHRFLRDINDGKMWARLMAHRTELSPQDLHIAQDFYDAECHHADHCIGRLIDWLRERELLDDTVVMVTADHGEAFNEQGVWGHGFCLADALTHVPLIVRCPRYWPARTQCSKLVQLHDVHDLCLSLARTGEPHTDQHPHCLTQATDPSWPGRRAAFSEFPVQTETLQMLHKLNPAFEPRHWACPMWAVRTAEWRYVEYQGSHCELYNLVEDPAEQKPLLDHHHDVAHRCQSLLDEHRGGPAAPPLQTVPAADEHVDEVVRERLRALGYLD